MNKVEQARNIFGEFDRQHIVTELDSVLEGYRGLASRGEIEQLDRSVRQRVDIFFRENILQEILVRCYFCGIPAIVKDAAIGTDDYGYATLDFCAVESTKGLQDYSRGSPPNSTPTNLVGRPKPVRAIKLRKPEAKFYWDNNHKLLVVKQEYNPASILDEAGITYTESKDAFPAYGSENPWLAFHITGEKEKANA